MGRASRVPSFGFEKAVEFCIGVFIVPSSNLFPKSLMCHARSAWWLETKSYARIVPPLPRFTRQPQKEKMFLAFRICARPIFSENGKDIFLFGVLPSKYSGRWRDWPLFFARTRRNSPHTPLPPCSCGDGRKFWRRLFSFPCPTTRARKSLRNSL